MCTISTMSTYSLRELRDSLGNVVREVGFTGHEAIITDNGKEIAVVISMEDYERLHEHADVADALTLRRTRQRDFEPVSLEQMLTDLGVSIEEFARESA